MEFIGVLSVDPVLAHFEGGEEGGMEDNATVSVGADPLMLETTAERQAHSPPPSLIPRVHCISARQLSHSHPLIPQSVAVPLERAGRLEREGERQRERKRKRQGKGKKEQWMGVGLSQVSSQCKCGVVFTARCEYT